MWAAKAQAEIAIPRPKALGMPTLSISLKSFKLSFRLSVLKVMMYLGLIYSMNRTKQSVASEIIVARAAPKVPRGGIMEPAPKMRR